MMNYAELLSFLDYDSEVYCPTNLHIESEIDSNSFVQVTANETIIMDTTVSATSHITVMAGNEINLKAGFQVDSGATFIESIGNCAGIAFQNSEASMYSKIGHLSKISKSR